MLANNGPTCLSTEIAPIKNIVKSIKKRKTQNKITNVRLFRVANIDSLS